MKKQGPFKWDNDDDLGSGKELGKWEKESSHDAVVYYHRDKDAVAQARALDLLRTTDAVIDELYDFFGTRLDADSLNHRKLPVYLADNDTEYKAVMEKLSDGSAVPSNPDGCSFIEIGPLGCINRGIVLNASNVFKTDDFGNYAYEPIIRRELARYSYYNLNDYGKEGTQTDWFVNGLIDYLSFGCNDSIYHSQEFADYVINDFPLTSNPVKTKYASQAWASLINYVNNCMDSNILQDMIRFSCNHDISDYFENAGLDANGLKDYWVSTIYQTADTTVIVEELF